MHPDYLNIITVLPFLFIATLCKNVWVAIAIVAVVIFSTTHHLCSYSLTLEHHQCARTFTADCVVQLLAIIFIFLSAPAAPLYVKYMAIVVASTAALAIIFYMYARVPNDATYIHINDTNTNTVWDASSYCAWVLTVVYMTCVLLVYDQMSAHVWFMMLCGIIVFVVGTHYTPLYDVAWPSLHVIGVLLTYLILRDLGIIFDFSSFFL